MDQKRKNTEFDSQIDVLPSSQPIFSIQCDIFHSQFFNCALSFVHFFFNYFWIVVLISQLLAFGHAESLKDRISKKIIF